MAKRFTDTNKWRDEWWGALDNDYRMIWLYLVDSCSIAGIWKKDFRGLNFNCNTNITPEEFHKAFKSRVVDRGHYYFIPKFLLFQCPKGLNSNKPAVVSIVNELESYCLTELVNQLFGNDYLIIKDKGKDKRKEKGKDKDSVESEIFSDETFIENLETTHKGKDFRDAFSQCFIYWMNSKSPPTEISEWKQKLSTWLIKYQPSKNNEHGRKDAKKSPGLIAGEQITRTGFGTI